MKMENNLKFFCSEIRSIEIVRRNMQQDFYSIAKKNNAPKAGDIIIVRVLDDTCGYNSVECSDGRSVPLYNGDVFVGVLGNRRSGTNLVGEVPHSCIEKGDELNLLAIGGIVGKIICVDNKHRKGQAMPLEVVGFLSNKLGEIDNISNYKKVFTANKTKENLGSIPVYFVMGTSAETGKTTTLCNMIRWIRSNRPEKKISCMKVCGTGRLKDKLNYIDAGGDTCVDFVDAGWASTYGMRENEYRNMLTDLYAHARKNADIIIVEVGGDLIEGNADIAIQFSNELNAKKVVVVNDAMGAMMALKILDYQNNSENIFVATLWQNPFALRERLGVDDIINVANRGEISRVMEGMI